MACRHSRGYLVRGLPLFYPAHGCHPLALQPLGSSRSDVLPLAYRTHAAINGHEVGQRGRPALLSRPPRGRKATGITSLRMRRGIRFLQNNSVVKDKKITRLSMQFSIGIPAILFFRPSKNNLQYKIGALYDQHCR